MMRFGRSMMRFGFTKDIMVALMKYGTLWSTMVRFVKPKRTIAFQSTQWRFKAHHDPMVPKKAEALQMPRHLKQHRQTERS